MRCSRVGSGLALASGAPGGFSGLGFATRALVLVPSEHAIRLDAGFRNAPAERRSSAPARRPSSLVTWSQSPTPHTTAAPLHGDQHGPPFVCEQVRAHVPHLPCWWRFARPATPLQ